MALRLVHPESHRSFEHITLHPHLSSILPQPTQLLTFGLRQRPVIVGAGLAILGDPVTQGFLVHPQLAGDLSDLPVRLADLCTAPALKSGVITSS